MTKLHKPLLKVPAGQVYVAGKVLHTADDETYVITGDHSIADILRYLVRCASHDADYIRALLEEMYNLTSEVDKTTEISKSLKEALDKIEFLENSANGG